MIDKEDLNVASSFEYTDAGFKMEFTLLQKSPLTRTDISALAPTLLLSMVIQLCKTVGISFIEALKMAQEGQIVTTSDHENLA